MISHELYQKLDTLIASKNIQLYDAEFLKENKNLILRISLFKKEGISLDDCEMVSNLIAPLLDVELENLENYHLEVSSPGIERVLKKPQHFLCSIGEKVVVTLPDKTKIEGILETYDNEAITIRDSKEEAKTLLLSECKKVKTIFDWDSNLLYQ